MGDEGTNGCEEDIDSGFTRVLTLPEAHIASTVQAMNRMCFYQALKESAKRERPSLVVF